MSMTSVQEMNEVELYFYIEACGAYIWRMNHEMSHGRIPQEQHPGIDKGIQEVREKQLTAVRELPRIGLEQPLDSSGIATSAYWTWYRKWNYWHHNMSVDAWKIVDQTLSTGLTDEQVVKYRQEADELQEAMKAAKKPEGQCCCCQGPCNEGLQDEAKRD